MVINAFAVYTVTLEIADEIRTVRKMIFALAVHLVRNKIAFVPDVFSVIPYAVAVHETVLEFAFVIIFVRNNVLTESVGSFADNVAFVIFAGIIEFAVISDVKRNREFLRAKHFGLVVNGFFDFSYKNRLTFFKIRFEIFAVRTRIIRFAVD